MSETTEVILEKTPAEIKKEQAKTNRIAAMARARESKKNKVVMAEQAITKNETVIPKTDSKIVWFGEVDMNKKGVPSSDYPGWTFDQQIQELDREISSIERGFDLELYSGKDKVKMRELLKQKKDRYEAIQSSRPKLTGKDKDAVYASFKDLGKRIGDSMFTYSDMQKGTADAHVEAERMVMPCIEIKSELESDFCKQSGIKIVDGKISRNHASQMAQIFGKALGEGIIDMERFRNQR